MTLELDPQPPALPGKPVRAWATATDANGGHGRELPLPSVADVTCGAVDHTGRLVRYAGSVVKTLELHGSVVTSKAERIGELLLNWHNDGGATPPGIALPSDRLNASLIGEPVGTPRSLIATMLKLEVVSWLRHDQVSWKLDAHRFSAVRGGAPHTRCGASSWCKDELLSGVDRAHGF